MTDTKFVDGLFVNAPRENAPDFVKMSMAFKPAEFIKWLEEQDPNDKGYVRLQVKVSKSGKWYAEKDNWKPTDKKAEPEKPTKKPFKDDEIPFGNDSDDIPF